MMENIYSNKGNSSGNSRNGDKAAALITESQQGAGTLSPSTPAPQSPDASGLHLFYAIIVNN